MKSTKSPNESDASSLKIPAAKVNDFKPMWGEAFSDWLAGYDWWGYLQEDVLLGRLAGHCLTAELLERFDIISPFWYPMNASGVFMLLRNTPRLTALWRRSSDADRVLSDPRYLVFDEWWGNSKDNFAAVIGRHTWVNSCMRDALRVRCDLG